MAHLCVTTTCKRKSVATCHCCKENLCLDHLKEHQDLLISNINPLVDRINTVGVRLKAFDVSQVVGNCRQKLDEWRDTSRTMINCLYERKCQELDQYVTEKMERQRENINATQSRMAEMVREQEATRPDIAFLTASIHDIEKEMSNIEEDFCTVEIRSLIVDDSFICIKGSNKSSLDLAALSTPYKTINCPKESSPVLTSNDRFLIMHNEPNLYLIDKELTVAKHSAWSHGKIYSICWSSTLVRFIIISGETIFLLDERTLLAEKAQIDQNQKWGSCTCSNANLYITTWESGSSIIQYALSSSIQLVKQWKSPITCSEQEIIHDIGYNNNTLALLIKDKSTRMINMELRSSNTLERIWLSQMNMKPSRLFFKFHCCLLNHNDWLMVDHVNEQLLHIEKDGKLKGTYAYNSHPKSAILFGPHIIAVLIEKSLNFHKV